LSAKSSFLTSSKLPERSVRFKLHQATTRMEGVAASLPHYINYIP
jgi:hypothetical protein